MIIKQLKKILDYIKKLLTVSWFQANPISITELHGTWNALSEQAKHCSPLIGAMYWETNYIKKLYYFGNALQTNSKDKLTFAGDKTIEVIHRLFLEVQGSFNLSTNKDYVTAHLSPKVLGEIIGTLESCKHQKPNVLAEDLITVITNHPDYQASIEAEKKARPVGYGTNPFSTSTQKKRLTALCKAIAQSFSEQGWHHDQHYPSYTTHAILLTVVYRKTNNRQDLHNYFESLQATITRNNQEQPLIFDHHKFNGATRYDHQSLNTMHEQPFTYEIFEQYILGGLFHFYRQPLPKIFEYKNVLYQTTTYPNCIESIVRNLCNIALYDDKTGTFDYTKYSTISDVVKAFYTYNKQSENADQANVHQAWVNILENQLFVLYNRCLKDDKPIYLDGKFMRVTQAFITTNQNNIIPEVPFQYIVRSFGEQKIKIYLVPENAPNCYLYNMRASLTNIIIQLNQLLELTLFDNLETLILDKTFNETYFQPLIEKLGWQLENNISNWDTIGWEQPVKLELGVNNISFSINLSETHGYVGTPSFVSKFPSITIEDLNHHWLNSMRALVVGIHKPADFKFTDTRTKIQFYCMNDLFNDTNKLEFFKHMTDQEKTTSIYTISHIADRLEMTDDLIYHLEFLTLLSNKQSKHPAMQPFIKKMIKVAKEEIASDDDYTKNVGQWFFIELVKKEQCYNEAIIAAIATIASDVNYIKKSALKLFETLFDKNQGFEQATDLSETHNYPELSMLLKQKKSPF